MISGGLRRSTDSSAISESDEVIKRKSRENRGPKEGRKSGSWLWGENRGPEKGRETGEWGPKEVNDMIGTW